MNIIPNIFMKELFVEAISTTSLHIYRLLESPVLNNKYEIKEIIKVLDIENRIKIIESLIKNIINTNYTIVYCLESLHYIILNIREDIQKIN